MKPRQGDHNEQNQICVKAPTGKLSYVEREGALPSESSHPRVKQERRGEIQE
ncbi:MAG: hypothetical protein JSU86_09535 [Phycisphaerales bacterium]|nr:MAG: hypothetical protein JSU86_09535 [Phycisphaerales bacterium]